ncbi:hemolysin family protein [Aegicerativicinus sediminis]|uniref:hemolysin family protein n=1 Tax=Aegicerativicinus sediminis TaxID=2893202 RepID=UPI001E2FD695|nr:hemolysin family protein [Aegicerativicinus sediminis]
METAWLIVILMLILSAFFSGMEIAFVSSNKIHIEIEKKKEDFLAGILTKITDRPSKFIATMLIGNNIALVIYGFLMGDILVDWFQSMLPANSTVVNYLLNDLSLLSQTVISTLIILITAEFLPKVFFQIYSNTFLRLFAVPAYLFYMLFTYISDFVIWISNKVLKYFFKADGDDVKLAMTKVELGHYISEQMESIEEDDEVDSEIQIFQNALEFSEVKARAVMIPRTEIVAVDVTDSVKNVNALFTSTGLSKILVYKGTIDDIVGYVHSFELFKKPKSLSSISRPVLYVPETMLVKDILNMLTRRRMSMAVVIDEYGGTAGIMTIEDIVEELFGEIEDEHDTVVLIEEQLDERNYKFSARLEVDYINETYKLDLPEGENYETLGGLIMDETEGIPDVNEVILIENFQFKILEASSTKIDVVSLRILEED